MTITALGSGTAAQSLGELSAVASTTTSSKTDASVATPASDSSDVSGPAKMLSDLKALQDSDPAKFKEVMNKISSGLKDAAASASDPGEKQALSDMASKFQSAGQSGDLSALRPGPPGGSDAAHGPPPGPPPEKSEVAKASAASTGSAKTSSAKTPDPADKNRDGRVTSTERQTYDKARAAKAAARAYHKRSGTSDSGQAVASKVSSVVQSALSGAKQASA